MITCLSQECHEFTGLQAAGTEPFLCTLLVGFTPPPPPGSFFSAQVETIYLINPATCDSTLVKAAVTLCFVSLLVARVPPP